MLVREFRYKILRSYRKFEMHTVQQLFVIKTFLEFWSKVLIINGDHVYKAKLLQLMTAMYHIFVEDTAVMIMSSLTCQYLVVTF